MLCKNCNGSHIKMETMLQANGCVVFIEKYLDTTFLSCFSGFNTIRKDSLLLSLFGRKLCLHFHFQEFGFIFPFSCAVLAQDARIHSFKLYLEGNYVYISIFNHLA